MTTLAQSAAQFLRGTWVAILAGVSAIGDPLEFAKLVGMVDPSTRWTLGANVMRSIFMLIAFSWLFGWYHQTRQRYESANPEPNMPLHIACRWIAKHSVWAASYNPQFDDEWVEHVDDELMSKVAQGRIELFGKGPRNGVVNSGAMQHVAGAFKSTAQWDAHKLVGDEPPTHMWQSKDDGGRVYYTVMLDGRQVRKVWPRRSIWAALMRRSPIERTGDYRAIFAKQDAYYKEHLGFVPAPLDAIL